MHIYTYIYALIIIILTYDVIERSGINLVTF